MAELDLVAIRSELRTALRAQAGLAGVTVYDCVTPQPALPAIHVGAPTSITFHATYGETSDVTIKLTLEVARESHETAQRTLDRWLSRPGPIVALEQHDAVAWSELAVQGTNAEPRSLGDPSAGETASLAVDVLVDINT